MKYLTGVVPSEDVRTYLWIYLTYLSTLITIVLTVQSSPLHKESTDWYRATTEIKQRLIVNSSISQTS